MNEAEVLNTLNEAYFSETPHELPVIRLLPRLLQGVRMFVDVGASLGQFTKAASQLMTEGSIVAIEADPLRHRELARNCQQWATGSRASIRVVHGAVSSGPGSLKFHVTNTSVSGSIFQHDLQHLDEGTRRNVNWMEVTVPAVALDDLLDGAVPGLVKMDIEGAELAAMKGASRILKARQTLWLIELHDFARDGGVRVPEAVREIFASHGYNEIIFHGKSLFYVGSGSRLGSIWWKHAPRTPLVKLAQRVKGLLRG